MPKLLKKDNTQIFKSKQESLGGLRNSNKMTRDILELQPESNSPLMLEGGSKK